MNTVELEEILSVTLSAAREASQLVHRAYRRPTEVEHKGVVDLVTAFDRQSETLLTERLSAAFDFAIVGEEAGGQAAKAGPTFFVDPIDGTTNFVHGHPFWCVSIGLVNEGLPVLGVVVAPALGLSWYGYVADGGEQKSCRREWGSARADGLSVEEASVPSGTKNFDDALLATGFPYDRRTSAQNNFDAFVAIKRRCRAVRRCGSAALDLCLVADGTYDGYWERKVRPWDIAGGIAIVRGAGGRVTDFDGGGDYIRSGQVIATSGHVHDALLTALRDAETVSTT